MLRSLGTENTEKTNKKWLKNGTKRTWFLERRNEKTSISSIQQKRSYTLQPVTLLTKTKELGDPLVRRGGRRRWVDPVVLHGCLSEQFDEVVALAVEEVALEPVTLSVGVDSVAVQGVLLPAPLC